MGNKIWGNREKSISGEFDGFIYQEPLENLGFSWEFDEFNFKDYKPQLYVVFKKLRTTRRSES